MDPRATGASSRDFMTSWVEGGPVPVPRYTCERLVKPCLVVSPTPSRDDEEGREEGVVPEALNGD